MNAPSDNSMTGSEQPNEQREASELTSQELDKATGGVAKTAAGIGSKVNPGAISRDDEAPKETVTFEYGSLAIKYSQQNSN